MEQINQIIKNLKSIPKIVENKNLFFKEYSKLGTIGVLETKFFEGKFLFRSRINSSNKSYSSKNEISYPPKPSNFFGRANCPNKRMFYGSYTPAFMGGEGIEEAYIINAYEISPFLRDNNSKGQRKITVGMWKVKRSIRLAAIIFHKDFANKTEISKNLNIDFDKELQKHKQYEKETRLWNEFISKEFAMDVDDSNDSEYIISATYTEFLINKGLDGVIYPTVQLKGRGFNIALTINAVDTSLELDTVGEGCLYKDEMNTLLDWERSCIVNNQNEIKFKDDPDKLGSELCNKIIKEQKNNCC